MDTQSRDVYMSCLKRRFVLANCFTFINTGSRGESDSITHHRSAAFRYEHSVQNQELTPYSWKCDVAVMEL